MDSTSIVRKFFDAINAQDDEGAAKLVTSDSVFVELPTGRTYRGPEGVRENFRFWFGAFPDGSVEIRNLIGTGDTVVVEYIGRGTNTGPMQTDQGEMPATGKSVQLEFCDVVQIKGDKIAGGRSYWDSGSMMRQLGLIPEAVRAQTR